MTLKLHIKPKYAPKKKKLYMGTTAKEKRTKYLLNPTILSDKIISKVTVTIVTYIAVSKEIYRGKRI
jgi:hypothetical protein